MSKYLWEESWSIVTLISSWVKMSVLWDPTIRWSGRSVLSVTWLSMWHSLQEREGNHCSYESKGVETVAVVVEHWRCCEHCVTLYPGLRSIWSLCSKERRLEERDWSAVVLSHITRPQQSRQQQSLQRTIETTTWLPKETTQDRRSQRSYSMLRFAYLETIRLINFSSLSLVIRVNHFHL